MMSVLRALEFYSGIGGMHAALKCVAAAATMLEAFDINQNANLVYEHDFGRRVKERNLDHITAQELDSYAADLWMLAPPCQPFTRQGKQRGGQDYRSCSFLNILQQIKLMQHPPKWLLLENVVGFEMSDVHQLLADVLTAGGYHKQEFILTPLQYGVPYSRPRYFCLGSKHPFPVQLPSNDSPALCTPALLLELKRSQADQQDIMAAATQPMASHIKQVQSIGQYLWSGSQQQQQQQRQQRQTLTHSPALPTQEQQQPQQREQLASAQPVSATGYRVPDAVIDKHAEVIDVVTAASCSCNCFTKAYGKLARGAGSLLATVDPATVDPKWQLVNGTGSLFYEGYPNTPTDWLEGTRTAGDATSMQQPDTCTAHVDADSGNAADGVRSMAGRAQGPMYEPGSPQILTAVAASEPGMFTKQGLAQAWKQLGLRYFTPAEIAKLHSFPQHFSFPPSLSARECYKLLGNSLSVVVVADLLTYLLAADLSSLVSDSPIDN